MKCPKCGSRNNEVIDSRPFEKWRTRRRECKGCKHRFTTREVVIKEDAGR